MFRLNLLTFPCPQAPSSIDEAGLSIFLHLKFDCMQSFSSTLPAVSKKTSVHQVVSQLITSLQPFAVRRNNLLLNDIPRDFAVDIDGNMLAYMLTQLVNSAVESTENRCIHIEAINSGDHTTIRVKDLDTYIYHTMGLNDLGPIAD